MTEVRKTTAQYLNGLAVAVLATAGGAFLGNHTSEAILLLAGLVSLGAHALAVWVVKGVRATPQFRSPVLSISKLRAPFICEIGWKEGCWRKAALGR
ncbi:hypothetical protein [Devosia naphthalenivorans]|uniref:hypothetical protein n=1 Tax=Devosia naphthalenivorans TaxID=2082392 RepID=UPI0013B051CA|nr:hypothetical protein [Devosia naphthalenivorans]